MVSDSVTSVMADKVILLFRPVISMIRVLEQMVASVNRVTTLFNIKQLALSTLTSAHGKYFKLTLTH